MSDLFKDLMKAADNKYATTVEDGIPGADVTGFISTGSHSLNALLSGSLYGGFADNKVTALAGEPATGKTYFAVNIVKQFLDDNPNALVFYFESEASVTSKMFIERGCDVSRIRNMPVDTIENFRSQVIRILDTYIESNDEDKPKLLFVLDSLGNLSTNKEIEDMTAGKATRDMTRAQLIRGAFRAITLKLGRAKCAMIITNHVYDVIGQYVATKKMGGGSGLDYAASTIIFLSKAKEKVDTDVVGVRIKAVLRKSRLTIEEKKVETLLNYKTGLDPYYGLIPLAEKFGIFKKVSTKYEMPDGSKYFESAILKNPSKFFTPEIMKELDDKCKDEFLYGKTSACNVTEDE